MDDSVLTTSFTPITHGPSYCGDLPSSRATLALTLRHPFTTPSTAATRATFDFSSFSWELTLSREPRSPRRLSAQVRCLGPSGVVNDKGTPLAAATAAWESPPAEFAVYLLRSDRQVVAAEGGVGVRRYRTDVAVAGVTGFVRVRDVRNECTTKDGGVRVVVVARAGEGVGQGKPGRGGEAASLLLRMLDDPVGSLADVELRGMDYGMDGCGGLPAHRAVLAASSEYFRNMFRPGNFKEGNLGHGVVSFERVSCRGLRVAVRFLYGDRSVVVAGSEITNDTDLFLDIWLFSHVLLLRELEREMAELAFLAAHHGGMVRVSGEGYCSPALVRVFTQAVTQKSGVALARLARLFEELLPFPRGSALRAAVMRFTVDEIEALLQELPPTRQWLELARSWLESGEGEDRAVHGATVCAAFAIDEMDAEELRDVDAFAFAKPYLGEEELWRIWRKIVELPVVAFCPRFGVHELEPRSMLGHCDVVVEEGVRVPL